MNVNEQSKSVVFSNGLEITKTTVTFYDTHTELLTLLQINDDWFHMEHRSVAKRSTEPHLEMHQRLMNDFRVRRAEQQRAKSRTKRDLIIKRPSNILTMLNDERWPQMWYLVSNFNQQQIMCVYLSVRYNTTEYCVRQDYLSVAPINKHIILCSQSIKDKNII